MVPQAGNRATPKSEILLVMTAGDSPPLGNVWRITVKGSNFYFDTVGSPVNAMHVSLHGPQKDFTHHRFHLKIDPRAASDARDSGHFVEHMVPSKGQPFHGRQVADGAYQVIRPRWRWHLQRSRFRTAALSRNAPEIGEGRSGRKLAAILKENSAWDVDLFVAYGKPFWPSQFGARTGDARLGPVPNDSGMWLTATSTHRAEMSSPSPEHLVPRLPGRDETPNRLTCGGLGPEGEDDMYWFVETITARELLESWPARDA